jgi:uncharacterized membrane protein YphA (DoxX/SURF4 family)
MRAIIFVERLKQHTALQIFTIYLRYLIGGAFIIAAIGMGKLSGKSFIDSATPIGELMPIQQFFRVMAESGLYWKFIGWFQIVCGALLMTQRFARLGALLFFGMIVNIFVITVSYHFQGTPVVTGLMTLAATYLLVWDMHALQFIVRKPQHSNLIEPQALKVHDQNYWGILGVIMVISIIAIALIKYNVIFALLSPLVIGFAGFILFFFLPDKATKTAV